MKEIWKQEDERRESGFRLIIHRQASKMLLTELQPVRNVIQFKPRDEYILYAAAIFDIWKDIETEKQLFSYSILTSDPSQFIQKNGHDRTPIFLSFKNGNKWLSLHDKEKEMTEFLNNELIHPNLEIEVDRPLKTGWEKRK